MSAKERFKILIAETSPVVSSGFANCLRKLTKFQLDIMEIVNMTELRNIIKKKSPDFILANPTFGGIFNPQHLKEEFSNQRFKIIAIELGRLSKQAAGLYDEIFNVTDDMETLQKKMSELCGTSEKEKEEKEPLSLREKEIISLVVKGLTNQEIADKLFLSVHTVITHRRNIARKLEIHSATGLTIYAIVNKIVELDDVVK